VSDVLRVAVTQWHATPDVAANLAVATDLVRASAADGAELVVLPENCLMLASNAEMRAAALTLDSAEVAALGDAARAGGTVVVLGGFKRRADDGRVFNTALVIGSDGVPAACYDKIHLFDARLNGQQFAASTVEVPGDGPLIVSVRGIRVAVTICYDVRFPELYRRLALAGAEVVLVPAAFTQTTGEAHWEVLLRARAIENASYVVASATIGGEAFATYGHALVVDPWGVVVADLGEQECAYRVVDLDLGRVREVRSALPVLRGVRPDAYATDPHHVSVG
jgi:predicted amidohydrolase